MALVRLVSDAAVDDPKSDILQYKRYVVPIVGVLTNPKAETPFTIGVFGTWGSGKSTVLKLVEKALIARSPDKFVLVQFNAWLHRKEPNMLVALLHALHAELAKKPGAAFIASAKKIADVLIRLGAEVLLKKLTLDAVSLEKLDTLEEKYQKAKGQVESEMRHLHDTLAGELRDIGNDGTRVVFFIDDLDRCEPEQIVDVLECLKLFFDLRNSFTIVAADKEIIDRGIEVRYGKFEFGKRMSNIGAEYIEKMVQLPLHLFPIFSDLAEEYIGRLETPPSFAPHIKLLASIVTLNPRRIKRVINTLTFFEAMAEVDETLADLDRRVLLRLAVLQLQSPEVYAEVGSDPDLLLALERTHINPKILNDPNAWTQYNEKRDAYREFCTANLRPRSYLSVLFAGAPFAGTGKALRRHLAMFGS